MDQNITVGAVCVYPNRVKDVVQALKGTNIPVASVATDFPAGQTPLPQRIAEIEQAIEAGAAEIDVVINRTLVLTGDWQNLYDEVRRFRETCGEATAHFVARAEWVTDLAIPLFRLARGPKVFFVTAVNLSFAVNEWILGNAAPVAPWPAEL